MRHRQQVAFDGALDERILDLQRDERRPRLPLGQHLGLRHLPRRRVGYADVAHLAGAHQVVERAHRLVDRRELVPGVHPVEVDVVGLQAAQRLLARGDDVLARGAAGVRIAGVKVREELRGNDHAVATRAIVGDEVADDLLRVAAGVAVGGVDEVAAQFQVAGDDRLGVGHA